MRTQTEKQEPVGGARAIVGNIWTILSAAFMVWLISGTIDRLIWVNSGNGLAGEINVQAVKGTGITCDERPLVEVKRRDDGSMDWRCGVSWPFIKHGNSKELAAVFDDVFAGIERTPASN